MDVREKITEAAGVGLDPLLDKEFEQMSQQLEKQKAKPLGS